MNNPVYKDHLGNEYESRAEMARTYNLTPHQLKLRLDRGWSLEKALTQPLQNKTETYIDNEGNFFKTVKELAEYHGLNVNSVYSKLHAGYSVTQVLEETSHFPKGNYIECYDHIGRKYASKLERATKYNINPDVVEDRLRRGWSLEDALTKEVHTSDRSLLDSKRDEDGYFRDRQGNAFKTLGEISQYYTISETTLSRNIRKYSTFSEAIEVILKNKEINKGGKGNGAKDHLGNAYPSMKQMCKAYGISDRTFQARIKKGWNLKSALTTPANNPATPKECTDHEGNNYKTLKDMADAYRIPLITLRYRQNNGWTLEQSLLIPIRYWRKLNNNEVLFELNGEEYYNYSCPLCNRLHIFTENEAREHMLKHIRNKEGNG